MISAHGQGRPYVMISAQEAEEMARQRNQRPAVQQTQTKDPKARRWYFRPMLDVLTGPNQRDRKEKRIYLDGATGKRHAEKLRDEMLAEINAPATTLQSQVQFGAVLDEYLKRADVRPGTLNQYESRIRAHIRPKWGAVRLCDITPMAFEDWVLGLARSKSRQTVDGIRAVFIKAWAAAIRWGMTQTVCPADCVPKPRIYALAPRILTVPTVLQFHQFLAALDEAVRRVVIFAAFTGLRIGEVLAILWRQLDADVLTVSRSIEQHSSKPGPTKSDKTREVPIGHIRGNFVRPAGVSPDAPAFPLRYQVVKTHIRKAAEAVGIYHPGFGAHTFRRAFATWFRDGQDAGVTQLAMDVMGHSQAATNDRYNRPAIAAQARRMEGLMGMVMGEKERVQ